MTASEIQEIIVTIGSQIAVVTPLILAAYFKLKNKMDKDLQDVKTHTDVALTKLNGMLSYVIHSFDRPAWLKVAVKRGDGEIEFRMLEVSEMFCRKFGFERHQYLGKTDLEAGWDMKTANGFRANDLAVWASGNPTTFVEEVAGKKIEVRKIRVQSADGVCKGIFGYAVRGGIDDFDKDFVHRETSDLTNQPKSANIPL